MAKKLLNILKYGLMLGLSGALMVYAMRGQDLSRIWEFMQQANYGWLGITMMLSVLGYFSRAWRWKMQIDPTGHKPGYWEVYHASMVGNLANMVLPRMGEVIRCSVLRRTAGVPVQVGIGTVITERIIDVVVLFGLLGTVLLLEFDKFWGFVMSLFNDRYASFDAHRTLILSVVGAAVAFGIILLILLWRNLERLRQNAFFNRAVEFVRGLLAGVFSFRKVEGKGIFLLHTIFTWLVYYLMDYLAFFAFPETAKLGMVAGLSVLTFGALGMATPVQGGIGVFHVMVQATLLVYGISKEAGIAYALVVHGAQTILVVLMGAISFAVTVLQTGRRAKLGLVDEPAELSAAHAHEG